MRRALRLGRSLGLWVGLVAACDGDDPAPADAADQPPVAGGCPEPASSDPFADCVDAFHPGDASFGHDRLPEIVLGPPRGADELGGMDVASLGCGGSITLHFAGLGIPDGPGDDLIVFENPFALGDDATFVEPARVLVSDDGERWREFPCDLESRPPVGCAGIGLVRYDPDDPAAAGDDPRDPAAAGGDAFDLADVGLERARWVRLIDVTEAYYDHSMWCLGDAGGFDLDAVAAIHSPL
ncbi:MAG: hypothetical protein R3A79_31160 [Nannocystaceae bacterium]